MATPSSFQVLRTQLDTLEHALHQVCQQRPQAHAGAIVRHETRIPSYVKVLIVVKSGPAVP
jgi:hypothetical protein